MLNQKLIVFAVSGALILTLNSACSKKGPTSSGEVKTETTTALKRINFDFDKYNIRSDAAPIMQENASWLKANTNSNIIVEGHCDEWGTNEYNMALGERRANSAKDYLVNLGVSGGRVSTVSFGEERPLDPGHNEQAWATNRRAEFVVRK
jgi:peptidoglycan-associated lipoprotein